MIPLTVGSGIAEITPEAGHPHYRGELAGIVMPATGIKTSLYARALVLKQGNNKGALLICDLNALPRDIIRIVREQASGQTGIPYENISVAATHTHTAPAIRDIVPAYADREAAGKLTNEDRQGYVSQLISAMTMAIVTANKQAKVSELLTGKGKVTGLSFNRRFLMTDGRVRFNPGPRNPKIVKSVGPVDPDVHFVLFKDPTKKFHASLTVFANHTDTEGSMEFSADYPYYLHKHLEEFFGEQLVSVFGTGPCGDINHINVNQPAGAAKNRLTEKIGTELAEEVSRRLPALKPSVPALKISSKTLYLPLQSLNETEVYWAHNDTGQLYQEREFLSTIRRRKILSLEQMRRREAIAPSATGEPWLLPVEIHVFQLNRETALVTLPGEVFVSLGLELKKKSPFANTMVIELANADIRYVPTLDAFAQGDYEAINSRLAPGSGEKLVDAALQMLNDMKSEKN